MNALLAVVLLSFCVLVICHGSGQEWQRQNERPVASQPCGQCTPATSRTPACAQCSPASPKAPVLQHEYTKYSQPLGWNDDLQLLQQRQSGNQEAQCPCVIRPGTNMCITYDMRYQAATLTEAVYGFPDLTLNVQQQKGAPADSTIAGPSTFDCNTKECQLCASRMTQKLREVGLMSRPVPGLNYTGASSASGYDYCSSYRFDHPKQPWTPPSRPTGDSSNEGDINNAINKLAQMGQEYYQQNLKNAPSRAFAAPTSNGRQAGRGKRQSNNSTATNMIGTRFNLSCSMKGVIDLVGDRMMSLCTSCWAWRQLPDNYFPQYINELLCDTRDTVCLSGWATCSQAYRTLNVLRQHTNGTWEPVTIEAGACCECKVQAGSALNSLVVGLGMSNSVPANPSP